MKRKIRKLVFNSLLVSPLVLVSTSCSSKSNSSNQETSNGSYTLWSNEELKNNKFSTLDSRNKKLNIVTARGADDIIDADFNDGRKNVDPLLGNIVNEQYKRLAQISYSLNFAFGQGNYLGTAWLLDFQIPNNLTLNKDGNTFTENNYPTKWYLATNSHVMDDLKTLNSPYNETNTIRKPNSSTTTVKFKKIINPQLGNGNGQYLKSSFNNSAYKTYWFNMSDFNYKPFENPPVSPIFLGFDYLKTSPSDFINNVPQPNNIPSDVEFSKVEELADFSVFEIDFEKIIPDNRENKTPNQLAMEFTSNYANWPIKEQFKPAPNSLLKESNLMNKQLYSLGFPQEEAIGGNRSTDDVALFINRPSSISDNEKDNGSKLVFERHYNTFKNTPGIFDFILGSPDFGYKFDPISNTVNSSGIIPYIFQGLGYVEQNGDMKAGSSGSILVDENNYIYGIHFASDFTAHVGINFALKCEGYNYNGAYGSYNLQPYDLINGGYENQRSSYKDQLRKKYGTKIKTYLFIDGL